MKTTKRRFETFSFYDHTGIEAHLERMAEKGWLLEKIGSFTWRYRRIEPQKLTFSVCYFPKASPFDPGPSDEQEMFYDFCRHTGWTLAAASGQMQIFYNERPNPVPIDTDPELAVEAVHQSAKKGFLLSQAVLAAVAVMNIITLLFRLRGNPIQTLAAPVNLFLMVCWPALLLIIGADVGSYFRWRHRALRAAEQGEFLATNSHPLLQKVLLAVVMAAFAWSMSTSGGAILTIGAAVTAGTLAVILIVSGIREVLKREKVSAGFNRAATLAACVVLTLLMVGVITPVLVGSIGRDGRPLPEELPLTLDDLTDVGDYDYASSDYLWKLESPLLAWFEARQSPWRHEDMVNNAPEMQYTVTVAKISVLYDVCRDHLLGKHGTRSTEWSYYNPISPAPWGAQEAYQLVIGDEHVNTGSRRHYLLCYEDRVIELLLSWEPTPAQMAVVAEKLGGQ